MLRYLRRINDYTDGALRWGILTNGARWRLYYAGARSTIDEYLEVDLSRIMGLDEDLLDTGITDEDRAHWLKVFATLFSRTAFERAAPDAPSFLERARKDAAFYEERVAKSLSDLVFDRLYPTLGKAVAKAAPSDVELDDIRQATLILLYRLLFILYAEDRGLLPVRDTRYIDYALRPAREAAMIASPSWTFDASQCGFFLQSASEIADAEQCFPITADDFARVNPNTGTAPIFRTRRDMELTTAIYANTPVLVDKSGEEPVAAWPVKYVRMFDMSNDSHLFRTRAELEKEEGAWSIGGNSWQSEAGEWLPLYEGKMVQAFDHRAASVVVNTDNLNRPAQPKGTTIDEHLDPHFTVEPQYWLSQESLPPEGKRPYLLAYKRIGSPTNIRTFIAALGPKAGYEVNANVIVPESQNDAATHARILANVNSILFDFVVRQKTQALTLNWYIVEQLPVIPPEAYARQFGPKSAAEIVREAVLELTYTAHDMAPFARDMGYVDEAGEVRERFVWDEDRRLALRAKLDALYFILYGIFDPADRAKGRDDVEYIYSTFPIFERQERAAYGSYRSRDLALAWINALLAGQPDAGVEV